MRSEPVYLTDGCAYVNRASDLYVNERAAQIAPVRMTGNYGSEILRRLRAFKPGNQPRAFFVQSSSPTSAKLTGHMPTWSRGMCFPLLPFGKPPGTTTASLL